MLVIFPPLCNRVFSKFLLTALAACIRAYPYFTCVSLGFKKIIFLEMSKTKLLTFVKFTKMCENTMIYLL